MGRQHRRGILRGLLCILFLLGAQQPARAQTATDPDNPRDPTAWHIETVGNRVQVRWQPDPTARANQNQWPLVEINGLQLPAQLLPFVASGSASPRLQVQRVTSRPLDQLDAAAVPVPPAIPQTVDGLLRPDLAKSDLVEDSLSALPDTPVFILRQGRMRGVDLLVIAVTQRFRQDGQPRALTSIDFAIDGVVPLETLPSPAGLTTQPFGVDTILPPAAMSGQVRVQVTVQRTGMQEIWLEDLRALGYVSNGTPLARLQLYHDGQPVALEEEEDRLRFYAPDPGDRWNTTDSYWLLLDSEDGLRMANRPAMTVEAAALPIVEQGWESGRWSAPIIYDSTMAGADRDHWFAADLRSGPEMEPMTLVLPIVSHLPALAETATFTLRISGYTKNAHSLLISAAQPAPTTTLLTWAGSGDYNASFSLDGRSQSILVATQEGQAADGILIDDLVWRRPVDLRFGYASALFETNPQPARLRLDQVARAARLYDISDPRRPVRVQLGEQPAGTLLLQSAGGERYLLLSDETRLFLPLISPIQASREVAQASALGWESGSNTQFRSASHPHPLLELLPALDFNTTLNVDALYVAPALFHAALQPLLDQRRSQGYRVMLVDVADIYAGWSNGQTAPEAIREFVRWVVANSSSPPQALTLVGDGTSDPFNYTGRNNTNFVPPYLLPVDPWLGETACETCFGQVDGTSPLDDPLPDVAVGRIPAKSASEVAFYVEKLLTYERVPAPVVDRSRMLFVADNYRDALGRVDGAGDFTVSADAAVAQQPAGTTIERVYYDPSSTHTQNPWREPDAATAWRKTLAGLNRGAGFVSYLGHAHHWQWASTDLNVDPPYLLGLYDGDGLTNGDKLPILLEMTCLTGMFQQPAFSGTTIDERLLLHSKGGAVAIWAPTGLGVAYGHDALQRGFYKQFWDDTSNDRRLGALVQAGYLALFSQGTCCQESVRTFLIMGDPLTLPQASTQKQLWFPHMFD